MLVRKGILTMLLLCDIQTLTKLAWTMAGRHSTHLLLHVSRNTTYRVGVEIGLGWSRSLLILSVARGLWRREASISTIDSRLCTLWVCWGRNGGCGRARRSCSLSVINVFLGSVHDLLLLLLVLGKNWDQVRWHFCVELEVFSEFLQVIELDSFVSFCC